MDLLEFRLYIANCMIKVDQVTTKKRGRTSNTPNESVELNIPKRKESRPINEIRHDSVGHIPVIDQMKNASRCKQLNCKGKSHVLCDKCKVHLCFQKERNCFQNFHRK